MEGKEVRKSGFTLIEMLIVVAILGVLAAVVIPYVGQFIGRGETEAAATELTNIQTAMTAMMVDNGLGTLPNPVTVATNDMGAFPDSTSDWTANPGGKMTDPKGIAYAAEDTRGYLLYGHDMTGGGSPGPEVNYVASRYTKGTYTVDALGMVNQVTTGYKF